MFTGVQLRHNDFWIFTDPSLTFTYNCNETFNKTSHTLLDKMSGHSEGQNNQGNAFVFIPYCRYRYKSDNEQLANIFPSYLISIYHMATTASMCIHKLDRY